MRKPEFCENEEVDQLHGNLAADQPHRFHCVDSTITPLLSKS